VSATGRAFAFNVARELGVGLRVGNRPEALPPGLSVGLIVGLMVGTPGRLATASGDVAGGTEPEIASLADAIGSLGRLAALPITVSRTDVTDGAVTGTVDSAWS
jgi:hypothetical protein